MEGKRKGSRRGEGCGRSKNFVNECPETRCSISREINEAIYISCCESFRKSPFLALPCCFRKASCLRLENGEHRAMKNIPLLEENILGN